MYHYGPCIAISHELNETIVFGPLDCYLHPFIHEFNYLKKGCGRSQSIRKHLA